MRKGRAAVRNVYAEDLHPGEHYAIGSHRVTEEEIRDFASSWDPQFFHLDAEASAAGPFGGIIASGIHTLAIFQKLIVEACFSDWNIIAGKEIRGLEFLRPVRPGDELSGEFVIEDLSFDDRGRAEFTARGVLINQDGKPVLRLDLVALIRSRG